MTATKSESGLVNGPPTVRRRLLQTVSRVAPSAHRSSLTGLRLAVGVVYVWFGMLKVVGDSPAAQLVHETVPWLGASWFVPALGGFEVAVGLWFIVGRGLLFVLPLFLAHMIGTMSVLLVVPDAAFQHHNPLMLTMDGEFVVKNLVLLCAGAAVATRALALRPRGSAY